MIGDYARTLNYEVICEAEDNICGTSLKRLFETENKRFHHAQK